MQHPLADDVEGAGDPGAHLARTQRAAALPGCAGYDGRGYSGPATGQSGVEDSGEVDHVGLAVVELAVERVRWTAPLEARVDDVPDQLHRAGVGDQHRLGVEPAVRRCRWRGRRRWRRRPRGSATPHGTGGRVPCWSIRSSETPSPHSLTTQVMPPSSSQSSTRSRWGSVTVAETRAASSRAGRALVVAGDRVDRDAARQDGVGGPPEPRALALGEQVVEAVAAGEDGAGADRTGHRFPRPDPARGEQCRGFDHHVTPLTSSAAGAPSGGRRGAARPSRFRGSPVPHGRAGHADAEPGPSAAGSAQRLPLRRRVTSAMTSFTSEIRSIRAIAR